MGGLAIIFEEEGLATTQISLIRLHTERTRPPRALWVPFELGRPLGVPGDAAFQKRVIVAALALLDAGSGPLIVDYAEEVPACASGPDDESLTGLVCPIRLPPAPDRDAPTTAIGIALVAEIGSLAPWYEFALSTRRRTTVGGSGLDVVEAGKYLAAFLNDQAVRCPRADMPAPRVLKLAFEDLKSYYTEAITAQAGYDASERVEDWLFRETVLGTALWRLREICLASTDAGYRYLGTNSIVPDRQVHRAP